MNIDLGKQYEHLLCGDCKERVTAETKKLKKIDLLFPKRVIRKFKGLLCKDCNKKVMEKMMRR